MPARLETRERGLELESDKCDSERRRRLTSDERVEHLQGVESAQEALHPAQEIILHSHPDVFERRA